MHGAKGGGPASFGGVAARETRLCLFHFSQGFLFTPFFTLTVVLASTVVIVGYCGVVIFSTCGLSIGVLSVDRLRFLTLTRPLVFCVCRASNGSLYNF